MIKRSLREIAAMLSVQQPEGDKSGPIINGVSIDTRTLHKGNLFIPIIGENFDGHAFVQIAYDSGAVASLWQTDHGQPPPNVPVILVKDTTVALQQLASAYRSELPVRIIGVTGSNGKTTTKDFVASILATTFQTLKTEGNLNNHIGLPLTLLKLDDTTEMAVLEMGMSERGEIELLSQLAKPEAVIITNVGEAHLEQLGSREEIARAKLEIMSGLGHGGLIVYNGDEPLLEQVIAELKTAAYKWDPEIKTFRFGMSQNNDYYPTGIMFDQEGCQFTFNKNKFPACYIPILGRHNVVNALAAIAVSKYMGVQETDIIKGLSQAEISGMRIEVVKGYNGVTILNDAYNASPSSVKAALQLLEEMKGYNRKIAVIGDMLELGEQEQQFHEEIGDLLDPAQVDYVFTFGEMAAHMAKRAMLKFNAQRVMSLPSKKDIAEEIMRLTNSSDLVLVKGSRGLKLEDVVTYLTRSANDMENGVE